MSYSPDDGCDYSDYRPRRRVSPYGCSDGFCGASDCSTCRPGTWDRAEEGDDAEVSALAARLHDAGYDDTPGGGFRKVHRVSYHVARKDHANGKIKAGQRYCQVIAYLVDADGCGSRLTTRWPVAS